MTEALLINSKRTDSEGTQVNLVNGSLSAVTALVQNCCSDSAEYLKKNLLITIL
jgi:hypothetical protein